MKTILSIAGSDNTGGAGIQADIKTILSHGMYPMTVITVVTAQNENGIYNFHKLPVTLIKDQLDSIFCMMKPDAIKIGLIGDITTAECIMDKLIQYKAKNIVFDPILTLSVESKNLLLNFKDIYYIKKKFIKIIDLITPNINEAKILLNNNSENNMTDMIYNLSKILNTNILLKGGHNKINCDDYLYIYKNKNILSLKGEKILTKNTHGTGCVLSTAIACNLAKEITMENSVYLAKQYLTKMLKSNKINFNLKYGPVPHEI